VNIREFERLLRRMGVRVEEVEASHVELYLKSGEVVRIESPTVLLLRAPGKVVVYQVQAHESSIRRETPRAQEHAAPAGYTPDEEDIALVMERTGASREEAIRALMESGGDLVQAVMKLLPQKGQGRAEQGT
jgi:nascent polypeptide-associated complex subunit alpha